MCVNAVSGSVVLFVCLGIFFDFLKSCAVTFTVQAVIVQLAVQLGSHNNAVKVHLLSCLICMFCSVRPRVSRESGP